MVWCSVKVIAISLSSFLSVTEVLKELRSRHFKCDNLFFTGVGKLHREWKDMLCLRSEGSVWFRGVSNLEVNLEIGRC